MSTKDIELHDLLTEAAEFIEETDTEQHRWPLSDTAERLIRELRAKARASRHSSRLTTTDH